MRNSGYESAFLLSQYIGEFHPDAHVKGFVGSSFIAFICNNLLAICLSNFMTINIYINSNSLVLTDVKPDNGNFTSYKNKNDFYDTVTEIKKNKKSSCITFFSTNLKQLFEDFKSNFNYLEAAGGVVINHEKKLLVIERLGMWDLPKGKIEENENNEIAALREVEEECGIKNHNIIKKLPSTHHIYDFRNKTILKKTYWYLMKTENEEKLIPQTEEDISDVFWMKPEQLDEFKKKTYSSIAELLDNSEEEILKLTHQP